MPVSMSRLSREYVYWPFTTPNDLTGVTADVAIMENPADIPEEGDWVLATIVDAETNHPAIRVLVGPDGDIEPAVAANQSWCRFHANPELPVRRLGVIEVV